MKTQREFRVWANNPNDSRGIHIFVAFALFLLFSPYTVFAQETLPIAITSPQPGQAVQGTLTVSGRSLVDGFASVEVAFAYASNPTDTWFLISANTQPVTDGTLADWDTTTITDGIYSLRLRVYQNDGTVHEVIVPDLRVRNYTPVETATPTASPTLDPLANLPTATALPTIIMTATPPPTPTRLPRNIAEITSLNIVTSLIYGAFSIGGIFMLFGLYLRLRRK